MVVYWLSKAMNVMASGKEVIKNIIILFVYWFSILKHISASNKAVLAKYNYFAIFPDFWECVWWHVAILNACLYQYIFLLIEIMKGANTSVIPWFSSFPHNFPLWVYNAISSWLPFVLLVIVRNYYPFKKYVESESFFFSLLSKHDVT